jgi:hypothetical protein
MRNAFFVPEGMDDGSQAIYRLVCVAKANPSRRARFDLRRPGLSRSKAKGRTQPTDHTVPYGDSSFFERIPGGKLPGNDHPVPTGHPRTRYAIWSTARHHRSKNSTAPSLRF